MEERVGPFLFSELLDCLSCHETGFPETTWPWCLLWKTRALQLEYWARVSPGGCFLLTLRACQPDYKPRDHRKAYRASSASGQPRKE